MVANSNGIEFTPPRIDLSEANIQVDKVVNKSSESTTIVISLRYKVVLQ